jgi:hypothetical protein
MKSLISSIAVAVALIVPAVSFAQASGDGITRAQVRAQVVQAEQQGVLHQPKAHYPQDNSQAGGKAGTADIDYGPATFGTSQSSQPSALTRYAVPHTIYSGH